MSGVYKKGQKFKPTPKQIKFDRSKETSSCSTAILETLAYRSLFKYPMSYRQLYTYLISDTQYDTEIFRAELRSLCKGRKVKAKNDLFYIDGVTPVNWKERAKNSLALLNEVDHVIKHLKSIPWIEMIGITGAVAAHNAPKNDDIDLFIIAKKNRIWITRLFVVLISKTLGRYRTQEDPSGKLCPNIFISVDNLGWPRTKRNVYVAHEILLMQPVFNRNQTYFKFIEANTWVFDYFSHLSIDYKHKKQERFKESSLLDLFERFLMIFQIWYMKNKKTSEIVSRDVIHFDKTDHSATILKNFSNLTKN